MDGFVDLQDAIKSESKSRLNRVEKLASFSAFILLGAAVYLAWPTLKSGMVGNSLNSDLMYAFIIIAWGVFVQDLGIMDKKSRSRIGIIATVAWLPLVVIALSYFEGDISELLGMSILLSVSYVVFYKQTDTPRRRRCNEIQIGNGSVRVCTICFSTYDDKF